MIELAKTLEQIQKMKSVTLPMNCRQYKPLELIVFCSFKGEPYSRTIKRVKIQPQQCKVTLWF